MWKGCMQFSADHNHFFENRSYLAHDELLCYYSGDPTGFDQDFLTN